MWAAASIVVLQSAVNSCVLLPFVLELCTNTDLGCRSVPNGIGCHCVPWIWRSWDRASLMYSFKYNQQDASLYNILYYCQCCTCFGQFFHPSSRARKLYTQHRVCAKPAATASVGEFQLTHASGGSKQASLAHTRYCVYSFRALDDGRKNRPKHYSIVDNKEYCITLHLVGYTCVPWINETLQKIIECALALKRHVAFLAIFRQILSKLSFNCNHKCRF